MIKILVLALAWSSTTASPAYQSFSLGEDGSYQFFYQTGKEAGSQSRQESRGPDGVVVGKYSYLAPTGELRVVNYRADELGYVAKGDVGVAGAEEAQVPAEGHQPPEDNDDAANDTSTEKPTEETSPDSTEDNSDSDEEEYEDDVKAMKIHEPSYDGPPEGFPIGFFDRGFQGLRRLPEPTKEGDVQDGKSVTTTDSKDASTNGDEDKTSGLRAFFPFYHVHAHAPLNPHPENPHVSYQYAYRNPDGHGYYYKY